MVATQMQNVEKAFRALADPTRLRILQLLVPGELCVCHLVGSLELSQPKVSRHLAYLRKTGFVTARKEGLWMYYSLAPLRSPLHQKLLECVELCVSGGADNLEATNPIPNKCCVPGC